MYNTTVPEDKAFYTNKDLFESSVLINNYCQSGISTSASESESTASGASTDDKTASD